MVHTFDLITWEPEAGRSLELGPAFSEWGMIVKNLYKIYMPGVDKASKFQTEVQILRIHVIASWVCSHL